MNKDLVALLTVTLITVLSWISFEIYHRSSSIYISQEIRKQAQPINPEIDTKLLEYLKQLSPN